MRIHECSFCFMLEKIKPLKREREVKEVILTRGSLSFNLKFPSVTWLEYEIKWS